MGRFLPPDHDAGDETTLGGYMAVHARPAAFEGADGMSYSVDIATGDTDDARNPVGGFLFFVRWNPGDPSVAGHLETDFLVEGASEEAVRGAIGAMPLAEVKRALDELIRARAAGDAPSRPWWDAMRDEGEPT